jgi:hypothetical protein
MSFSALILFPGDGCGHLFEIYPNYVPLQFSEGTWPVQRS